MMKDEKEEEHYRNFINAQYEYFKHIEPKRLADIDHCLRGKVKNPFHWISLAENPSTRHQSQTTDNDTAKKSNHRYKELSLIFHPDRNMERVEEATKYFQFLQTLIDESREDVLNDILLAEDKWHIMKELSSDGSIYFKKKYCDQVKMTRWFNWCKEYENQYVSPEELEVIIKEENKKMEIENQRLEEQNKILRQCIELQQKNKAYYEKINPTS